MVLFCEIDPLRDLAKHLIYRMRKLNVDLKAYQMDNWCHGVLSFDLKIGGIPESHKSNIYNVNFFKEIFDGKSS